MTTAIRAVPKTYRGVRFRSTLEADWAATLDSLSIGWEYEPEAVQLPSGELYRPDFYLPDCTTWLEVKGPHDERIGKVAELARATMHSPDCPGWDLPDLELLASSPRRARRYFDIVSAAPPGPTEVTIRCYRDAPPGYDGHHSERLDRYVVAGSEVVHRVRRAVSVDRSVCDAIDALGTTASPPGWNASTPLLCPCPRGPLIDALGPWRLVVVGRPSRRGAAVWACASDDLDSGSVGLVRCGNCDRYSFLTEHNTIDRDDNLVTNIDRMYARCCGAHGDDWAAATTFHSTSTETPRQTISFRKAPGAGGGSERRAVVSRVLRDAKARAEQRRRSPDGVTP